MAERTKVFDFLRGVLVLGMIAAHAWIHLLGAPTTDWFVQFIPAGFVLFSGMLIGYILQHRKSSSALAWRGAKLLILVTVINIPLWIEHEVPLGEILRLFFFGNPEFSAFDILIPIAFTIMTAPLFLRLRFPAFAAGIALLWILLADFFDISFFTLKFWSIGVFGVLFGRSSMMGKLLGIQYSKIGQLISGLVSLWSMAIMGGFGESSWLLQITFLLGLFGLCSRIAETDSCFARFFNICGRFSLLLYLLHVAVIRLWLWCGMEITSILEYVLVTSMLILCCFFSVLFLEKYLPRLPVLQKTYALIFR